MSYLFSSESVSEGHPDKVADQISDAILDQFLAYDDKARVACESFVTTGQVVIMGEVSSDVYIDLQTIARNTIKRIGYTKAEYQFDGDSCGILSAIHEPPMRRKIICPSASTWLISSCARWPISARRVRR